jgi:hypothetical protein
MSDDVSFGSIIQLSNKDRDNYLRLFSGKSGEGPFIWWNEGQDLRFVTDEGFYSEKMVLRSNGDLDMKAHKVKDLADPVNGQDAATKAYVDAATSSPTYIIGLSAEQGGYIFWVSPDGKHGLVAETVDQSLSSNWYNAQDIISNPSNHSVNGAKFRDWRMPTKYELNEMYLQRLAIGGFSNDFYWSSTEGGNNGAWGQSFNDGGQDYGDKTPNGDVRAVRAF